MKIQLVLSVLIGVYILCDSVYLASVTDGENRYCMIARYVGAFMSALYLIFEMHDGISILFGSTIALFMWPETYFRVMKFLSIEYPLIYHILIHRFKHRLRRRADYEAAN